MEKKHRCILCGAFEAEKKENGEFYCYACKGRFAEGLSDSQLSKAEAALGKKLDERDERQLCNAIHSLWNAVHEEYIDKSKSASIIAYCQEVQKYLPDDIRAKFYKAVCEGNNATVNGILKSHEILSEENRIYLPDIIEFAIRSLNIKSFIPIKELIEKVFDGELRTKYLNDLEEEAGNLREGFYDLSGDVFIAYSSKDLEWVKEICEYLENDKNRLRCFFAYRNLRHVSLGTNKNDYWENLKVAMRNCTCIVFLSSENSRNSECDAIVELAYLRDNLQEKPRIEYIGEKGKEYSRSDCDRGVEIVLDDVFETRNWYRKREDLRDWAIEQKLKAKTKGKKGTESATQEKEELRKLQEELRKAREEAERLKREAQERKQAEMVEQAHAAAEQQAEEERKRQEAAKKAEEERKAEAAAKKAEEERKAEAAAKKAEEERKKREEEEKRKKREVAINNPTLDNYDHEDFEIINTKLVEYNGKGGDVKIPQGVTEIGRSAFRECSRLTSITIPNSVKVIRKSAFLYCSNLTSVTIPHSVTTIGELAFSDCDSLTSITIPNSVTSIGDWAFDNCSSLTDIMFEGTAAEWNAIQKGQYWNSDTGNYTMYYIREEFEINGTVLVKYKGKGGDVKIPQGITEIGKKAFRDCSSLTSITIPNSVSSIGEYAFSDCSSLTSITIPNSVSSIGESAFSWCRSLASIVIPNSVTSIGNYVFNYCSSLTSITVASGNKKYHDAGNCIIETETKTLISGCQNSAIPTDGSVSSIGDKAFWRCSSLTSIEIPNSVTSIGNWAFNGCSGLTSVTIPNSVTSIGNWAFNDCSGLTSIIVASGNKEYHDAGNCLVETETKTLIRGCVNSVIPTDGSVTSIGDSAFDGCSSLTSITIPNSVTEIGESAFNDCSSLTSITIPNSVTTIGDDAFWGCSSLTSITIPNSVTSMGDNAFWRCSSLTSITFEGTKEEWNAILKGEDWDSDTGNYTVRCTEEELKAEAAAKKAEEERKRQAEEKRKRRAEAINNPTLENYIRKDFEINGTVLEAYKGKGGDVKIPQGITEIGECAFWRCSSLTSIEIPSSVSSIGESAFGVCRSLTSITIPNSVTSIGNGAFNSCSSLTSITIPNSVTLIGNYAFNYCSSLTSISMASGNKKYHVTENCLIETETKTLIRGCANSAIPTNGSVTTIGFCAFSGCSSLTSITIPNSVTSIGKWAFGDCSSLTSITVASGNKKYHDAGNCLIEAETKTLIRGCVNSVIPTDGSVTLIGEGAFSGCESLTNITIPNSVTTIGGEAFSDCSSLTSIKIPNSVSSIGESAFENCSSLTKITFNGTKKKWRAIQKDYSWNDGTGEYTVHCTFGKIKE